jgi:hypothetical protein
MWLAIWSGLFQLILAAGGIYVSLKPQKSEHHNCWIVGFVIVGLTGVLLTGFQTYSTDQKEKALQIQIEQLLKQSKDAGDGIQNLQKTADSALARPLIIQTPVPVTVAPVKPSLDQLCFNHQLTFRGQRIMGPFKQDTPARYLYRKTVSVKSRNCFYG